MCGITGYLFAGGRTAPPESVLCGMSSALTHRGPDSAGHWMDANAGVALGHRRLAVVDVSAAGAQPMRAPSGRYTLVFNGEIYNHLGLRADLERSGRAPIWRGHSDTETLLAGFDAWGVLATVEKAVGMFAFAL